METRHPQVPVLDFECDEEIAELITLMNNLEIETLLSCQDNDGQRGTVRRVWVEIYAEDLLPFLELLNRPDEAIDDPESLSGRMVNEWVPAGEDPETYVENRVWHYAAEVSRDGGEINPLAISIRFPHTDLDEVVARLRTAAREIAEVTAEPGDGPEG